MFLNPINRKMPSSLKKQRLILPLYNSLLKQTSTQKNQRLRTYQIAHHQTLSLPLSFLSKKMQRNLLKLILKQIQFMVALLINKKIIENTAEKENLAAQNAKVQMEKPFNLETEIGKLKIAIPLS